jgi:hypothetical protein
MASDTGWHSRRDTPKEPSTETVGGHQGPRSENRGHLPAEMCNTPVQSVEGRPLQCDTRVLRSRSLVTVKDDEMGEFLLRLLSG